MSINKKYLTEGEEQFMTNINDGKRMSGSWGVFHWEQY